MSESRYAVLIGNSDFPHEPKLASLRCPGNDVDGLNEILSSRSYGGFDNVIVLKNVPHHQAMVTMHEVFNQAEKDDLVLIYYSGHGKQDLEGQLYLASADTLMRFLTVTSIPIEGIKKLIRNSRTNKIVLILDCCYSGAVSGAFLRSDIDTELQRISKSSRGTYILTATTNFQTAVEREGDQYGLLTKHILEGIKSGGAARDDGLVTMDTLYTYVYDKISSESPQEPTKYELNVRGSDLIISRTSRVSRDEWRKRVRRKLYELDLPARIEAIAVQVIHLNLTQLSRKQACYNELLDQLLKDQLTVPEFIDQWYAAGERIDQINELYRRAQGATDNEAWDIAIDYWEKLLELDPDNKEASAKFQQAQLQKQKLAERIKSIYSQVEVATNNGNWNEAIVQLKALIELQPGNKEAMGALAEAQRKQKELEAQIVVSYRAAQSAMDQEDWDAAIAQWQVLLQLDPNHEETKTKLQQSELKKQELAERIKSLYRRARTAMAKEKWSGAVVQWKALIELEPGNQEAVNALAEAQRKQEDLEAQIAVSYRAAQSVMANKDWEAAIGHWQALLRLDPNHGEAKTKLAQAQLKKLEAQSALKEDANAPDQTPETSTGVESSPESATQRTEVQSYSLTSEAGSQIAEPSQPYRVSGAEAISPLAHFWSSSRVQDATSYIASLRKEPKKCPKCNELFPPYKFCMRDASPLVFRSFGARLLVLLETLVAKLRKQPRWFLPVVLGGILLLLSLIFASARILYFRDQKPRTGIGLPGVDPEQKAPMMPAGPALSTFSFPTFSVNTNGQPTTTQVEKTAHGFSLKLSDVYLEMVYIPGGEFTIGSTGTEMDLDRPGEANGPEITVKPFYLGKYEVTREEWAAVAKWPKIHQELNPNPSKARLKDQTANMNRLPVDNVTWSEAREFAERLSTKALQCTLPSEAEWEYACRARTVSPFAFSESVIRDSINYNGMERTQEPITHRTILTTKPVGSFNLANNFGLFDMHGNVWEWCMDLWHDDYKGIPNDAKPWTTGEGRVRVVRGGAWAYPLSASRSATRYSQHEEHKGVSMGFRLACYPQ